MSYILKTEDLGKTYGNTLILNGINLEISQGSALGIVGRNGVGKTTLIRCITGTIEKSSGFIYIKEEINKDFYKHVGVSLDLDWFYPNFTGKENLEYFMSLKGTTSHNQINNTLQKLGFDSAILNKPYKTYSLGTKKILSVVLALTNNPEIVILDEPFNGLDPIAEELLADYLIHEKSKGTGILISSHELDRITEICDEIGFLNKGFYTQKSVLDISKKTKMYIKLKVSNLTKSVMTLENDLRIKNYLVAEDNTLLIYDFSKEIEEILNRLKNNNIKVEFIGNCHGKLEDVILEMIN